MTKGKQRQLSDIFRSIYSRKKDIYAHEIILNSDKHLHNACGDVVDRYLVRILKIFV